MTEPRPYWRTLIERDVWLVAIGALAIFNGMDISPLFDPVLFFIRPVTRAFFLSSPIVLSYLTSVLISLMTLSVGGIPAALYEHLRGQRESSPVSLAIWLVATVLITLPAIMKVLGEE
ncbi:MAG: hypothetical protein F9K29_15265 [Hyphomicrobiaceae bacterium]|nr:MAG: hypothetical protein F9K29_15265 [Hyphomicrobiaceae bacterium]